MSDSHRLDQAIVTALRRIIRAIDLHSRDLLQQYGLTAPQLLTLQQMALLGPAPIGIVSAHVHVSQATMTGILDRLEQRGLVQRTRDGVDRRSVTVTITAEGTLLLRKAPSMLQDHFLHELGLLKASEQTNILLVLQKIAEMMGASELPAAPILVTGPEALIGNRSMDQKSRRQPSSRSTAARNKRKGKAARKPS